MQNSTELLSITKRRLMHSWKGQLHKYILEDNNSPTYKDNLT